MVLMTSQLMIPMLEIARDLKMVDTSAQWCYIISDTSFEKSNISLVTNLITEGNNIAFIYNYTRTSDECIGGIKCHANELLRSFTLGLSHAIREENAFYTQISDEEWEIVRPSKSTRRNEIMQTMLEDLQKTSKCSNCTSWRVSLETECGRWYWEIFCVYLWLNCWHRWAQPISGEPGINPQYTPIQVSTRQQLIKANSTRITMFFNCRMWDSGDVKLPKFYLPF